MVAMVIVILLALFAFIGPMIVPYSYDQQIRGANNLHPWHYSWEDKQRISAYMEEHNGMANMTPEEAVEQARAEAAAEGRELTAIEEARFAPTSAPAPRAAPSPRRTR